MPTSCFPAALQKSGNVLLAGDGTAKLGDFGLARAFTQSHVARGCTSFPGTFAYAAPEIFLNQTCSPASDIFRWGSLPASQLAACWEKLAPDLPLCQAVGWDASATLERACFGLPAPLHLSKQGRTASLLSAAVVRSNLLAPCFPAEMTERSHNRNDC